jgi:hypothetical protein
MTDIEWPPGWRVTVRPGGSVSVRIDIEQFHIWCSGGSEPKWYVDQVWIEDSDTSIVGPSDTRADAVEHLKNWFTGDYVPSGDEVVVRIGEKSTDYLPIFHNRHGEQYVAVPEGS